MTKNIITICLALMLVLSVVGCSKEEEKKIEFPFTVGEVENIEMFRSAVPAAAEKKVVTEAADIETLYNKFVKLTLTTKEVEEYAGATVYSFRFNLSDGTKYELIYVANGVKNGVLSSPTDGFEYFTSADIGWNWSYLNESYEVISVEESELPGNSKLQETLEWLDDEMEAIDSVEPETKQALDGYYVSCMTRTEKGVISLEVVDDELHIKGTFAYDTADAEKASDKYYKEYYFADKADAVEYIFILSADTQFIGSGGTAREEDAKYDRHKFEETYCTRQDLGLGLGLHITVENGVVTKIVTAS